MKISYILVVDWEQNDDLWCKIHKISQDVNFDQEQYPIAAFCTKTDAMWYLEHRLEAHFVDHVKEDRHVTESLYVWERKD